MLDKIFAAIGLLTLIAFLGIVTVYVMEPDLWVVTVIVVVIGSIFIVRELRSGNNRAEGEDQGGAGR